MTVFDGENISPFSSACFKQSSSITVCVVSEYMQPLYMWLYFSRAMFVQRHWRQKYRYCDTATEISQAGLEKYGIL